MGENIVKAQPNRIPSVLGTIIVLKILGALIFLAAVLILIYGKLANGIIKAALVSNTQLALSIIFLFVIYLVILFDFLRGYKWARIAFIAYEITLIAWLIQDNIIEFTALNTLRAADYLNIVLPALIVLYVIAGKNVKASWNG